MADPATAAGSVVVLADDLIWASRLVDAIAAAGASPRWARRLEDLPALVEAEPVATIALIDLTTRAYDGVAAIHAARATGARVFAVGQHDDVARRRAALDAGAERVLSYRALFEGGPKLIGGWLGR